MKRHRLIAFFVLAYGLSWGNYFLTKAWPAFPFLFPYGPLLAALIVSYATQGKPGLKELARRCLRWRVGFKWYVFALLAPVGIALAAVAFNRILGAATLPGARFGSWYDFFTLLPLSLVDAPLGEESGWRGYALPLFSTRRSALLNSLMLGILLAGWHLPLVFFDQSLAPPYLLATIASAVVTNCVYYNTRGSALTAMLYHTAANTMGGAGLNVFHVFSGADVLRAFWFLAGVNWLVVVILVLVAGSQLTISPVSHDSRKVPAES